MDLTSLGNQYRADQQTLNQDAAAELAQVFPSFDFTNVDATLPGWATAVADVTAGLHAQSGDLAAVTYADIRSDAGVLGPYTPADVPMDANGLRAALIVRGAVDAKKAMAAGARITDIAPTIFANTTGAALRIGMNGGRDFMTRTADMDPRAQSWIRLTSGRPCGWCGMKAMNQYNSQAGAEGGFHDHDRCIAVPRFKDGLPDGYVEQIDEFQDVYSHAVVLNPNGAINAKLTIREMNRLMRS